MLPSSASCALAGGADGAIAAATSVIARICGRMWLSEGSEAGTRDHSGFGVRSTRTYQVFGSAGTGAPYSTFISFPRPKRRANLKIQKAHVNVLLWRNRRAGDRTVT